MTQPSLPGMATKPTLVLDIETCAAPISAADLPTIEALAAKREQSVAEFCALCPALARVVAVSMCNADTDSNMIAMDVSLLGANAASEGNHFRGYVGEHDLLRYVVETLAKYQRLITFNGRAFDLPTLVHRSRVNGVAVPSILSRAVYQKPWEIDPHIDLLNELTFGGATQRYGLAAYCVAFGIENPKRNGDGGNVGELVARGALDELVSYCRADITATAELWKKWSAAQ